MTTLKKKPNKKSESGSRKLDRLVAVHLLGFKKKKQGCEVEAGRLKANSYLRLLAGACSDKSKKTIRSMAKPADLKIRKFKSIPKFSTSPKWGAFLHQLLCSSGRYCCIKIDSDYYYTHDIWLTPSSFTADKENADDLHAPSLHISSEKLEAALAAAALIGLGYQCVDDLKGTGARVTVLEADEREALARASDLRSKELKKFYSGKRLKKNAQKNNN